MIKRIFSNTYVSSLFPCSVNLLLVNKSIKFVYSILLVWNMVSSRENLLLA